jgi:predicted Zn-dependent protease
MVSVLLVLVPAAANAQSGNRVAVVRDAEIEALVRDYARPIFKAAGISDRNIEIVLVNDDSFNAFVAGRRMFINTGALMDAGTPNEIIGVIAHEAGHIAGGHEQRMRDRLAGAQTMAIVATLLGVGVSAAGAASKNSGIAGAGSTLAIGGSEMARRYLLAYQRGEETIADRSAVTYLNRTHQSAQGMLTTFKRFENALVLSGTRGDPYLRSHPMPRERIANLDTLAHQSKYFNQKDSADLQLRHDLARAKIAAYTQGSGALARMFRDNSQSLPAQYGSAISNYLYGSPRDALRKVDNLIAQKPSYAYFHELRGDILMKANQPQEAAKSYRAALSRDRGKSGIIQVSLGQAELASGSNGNIKRAVTDLRQGLESEPDYVSGYRFLAQAYGQLGMIGDAELASAEGYFHAGVIKEAKIFALRAQQKFKKGSPQGLRAQDIINTKDSSGK